MSFNSAAYLQHQENIATGQVVVTGTYRRHKPIPTWKLKQDFLNSLSPEDRERLRNENEIKYKNYDNEY